MEAGLLEVAVGSEGLAEAELTHDDEGSAVGQRPVFVQALGVEPLALLEQLVTGGDDGGLGVGPQSAEKLAEERPIGGAGERIADLDEDLFGGDELTMEPLAEVGGTGMQRIPRVDQCDVEGGVNEPGLHFLGSP